jgi:hypothetical protein
MGRGKNMGGQLTMRSDQEAPKCHGSSLCAVWRAVCCVACSVLCGVQCVVWRAVCCVACSMLSQRGLKAACSSVLSQRV